MKKSEPVEKESHPEDNETYSLLEAKTILLRKVFGKLIYLNLSSKINLGMKLSQKVKANI